MGDKAAGHCSPIVTQVTALGVSPLLVGHPSPTATADEAGGQTATSKNWNTAEWPELCPNSLLHIPGPQAGAEHGFNRQRVGAPG